MKISRNDLKKLFKSLLLESDDYKKPMKYFDDLIYEIIPKIDPPKIKSKEFKKEIEKSIWYRSNPTFDNESLDNMEGEVEMLFKDMCDDLGIKNVDWGLMTGLAVDGDKMIDYLKNFYKRYRPYKFIDKTLNLDYPVKDSYSYPSGHAIISHMLADVLAYISPENRDKFEKLANKLSKSRLELGAHFPIDVKYGKIVGKKLAKEFLKRNHSNL